MTAIRLRAAQVHAWRMERQLLGQERAASPAEVSRRLIGVQAQVTSSAALSIALRSRRPLGTGPATNATTDALLDRSIVRSWAMRGTLHVFAAADVPLVAAALHGKEHWRRPAWLRWFGLTEPELESLIDTIGEILDDGVPRTRAELAAIVGERLGEQAGRHLLGSWGGVLKVASDRHYLVQSAEADTGVRFVRASRWIEGWRDADGDAALAHLVERYLAAYGPASIKETLRWWGASVLAIMKPVFADLGDALVEVEVDGDRGYVPRDDLAGIEATRPTRNRVHFLGGFDPLIVGAGLRQQLLPDAHLKRVSRTAGWISPVVVNDGRAIAVWDGRVDRSSYTITVDPFDLPDPRLRAAIESAAERVGEALGLRTTTSFGRVFTERGAALRIEPSDA